MNPSTIQAFQPCLHSTSSSLFLPHFPFPTSSSSSSSHFQTRYVWNPPNNDKECWKPVTPPTLFTTTASWSQQNKLSPPILPFPPFRPLRMLPPAITSSSSSPVSPASLKRTVITESEQVKKPLKRIRKSRKTSPRLLEPNGESRLDIAFTNFGTFPENPAHIQKWGKKGLIPNGLRGDFSFYGEKWSFEIVYKDLHTSLDKEEFYLLEFSIFHKDWKVCVVETVKQSRDRDRKGYTVCNHVFDLALDKKIEEYKKLLVDEEEKEMVSGGEGEESSSSSAAETRSNRLFKLQSRIEKLEPKKVSEGPLLFGLRHKRLRDEIEVMLSKGAETVLN